MKIRHFFVFCSFSFIVSFMSVYPIDARAPKTEKIAFSSNRDGAWDIYIMNPDGSKQGRTPTTSANNSVGKSEDGGLIRHRHQ